MRTDPSSLDPDDRDADLVRHIAFVRRLASTLTADGDDLAQETWLVTLSRDDAPSGSLRSFLAGVVRRLAGNTRRAAARRRTRETASSRSEVSPPAPDPLVESETVSRLLREIESLDPASRRILIARFYADHAIGTIAQREGLTVEATKSRLRRALEDLRRRLDRDVGRDWRGALLLLGTLAKPTVGAALSKTILTEILIVNGKTILVGAALVFVLLFATWFAFEMLDGDDSSDVVHRPSISSLDDEGASSSVVRRDVESLPPPERETLEGPVTNVVPARKEQTIVRGRVLDDRRRPLAAAQIALLHEAGEPRRATSDGEGRFSLDWPVSPSALPRGVCTASDGRGLSGVSEIPVGSAANGIIEIEIVCEPAHVLEFMVEDDGNPVARAEVSVVPTWQSRPFPTWRGVSDELGRCRIEGVTTGVSMVVALSDDGRVGSRRVLSPAPSIEPIVIDIGHATIEVSVVDRETQSPLEGAAVRLLHYVELEGNSWNGLPHGSGLPALTDADGHARIGGLEPGDRVYATATKEGYGDIPMPFNGLIEIKGIDDRLRLELPRPDVRSIAWSLVAGDAPVPADGATVVLSSGRRELGTTTVKEGAIMWNGSLQQGSGLVAIIDHRCYAVLTVPPRDVEIAVATVRRLRQLIVDIVDARGEPVAGHPVAVTLAGAFQAIIREDLVSDAAGRVVLEELVGGKALVDARSHRSRVERRDVSPAEVDLESGDGHVTITVARPIRVRGLVIADGERRLPPRYELDVRHGVVTDLREFPDEGRVEFLLFRDDDTAETIIELAPPFGSAFASSFATIAADDRSESVELEWRLESRRFITVEVRPRADDVVMLALVRYEGQAAAIVNTIGPRDYGRDPYVRLSNLSRGRFALVDLASDIIGARFENQGDASLSVTADFSKIRRVDGHIDAPPGTDFAGVTLWLTSNHLMNGNRQFPVDADGRFHFDVLTAERFEASLDARGFDADPQSVIVDPERPLTFRLLEK